MIGLADHATKAPPPKRNRMAAAIELRDAAIKLVQANGEWKPFATNIRVMQFDCDSLCVWYSEFPWHFGIDVWDERPERRKMLNVQWNDSRVEIISFRRGGWEGDLLQGMLRDEY